LAVSGKREIPATDPAPSQKKMACGVWRVDFPAHRPSPQPKKWQLAVGNSDPQTQPSRQKHNTRPMIWACVVFLFAGWLLVAF